jgi:SAM-dependent methyltransferase
VVELRGYSHPVQMGRYEKPSGMGGKYDHVRRLWEDRVTGFFLGKHLAELVRRKRKEKGRLRILDLGCGAGDGLELILGIPACERGARWQQRRPMVPWEMLDAYVGLDINDDLLEQAARRHGDDPQIRFVQGDLSNGLPPHVLEDHAPFDLYFSSYAMLSHFRDDQCSQILSDICRHASPHALFVGDWLGHYSWEWQQLWRGPEPDYFMDYRMSYLYSPSERQTLDIPSFPLRLMTPDDIACLAAGIGGASERQVKLLACFDRSILVGRHLDTREYNADLVPLRAGINSLFEPFRTTDLDSLMVDYHPRPGFEAVNTFYESYFRATNDLVAYTMEFLGSRCARGRDAAAASTAGAAGRRRRSDPLATAKEAMSEVTEASLSIGWSDPRANFIEPALACALQYLETSLQRGMGVGHSLGAIFELTM